VAHPAFAAARRAAARLLLAAGRAAIDRRATTANPPQVRAAAALWDGRTDRWRDAGQLHGPCCVYNAISAKII